MRAMQTRTRGASSRTSGNVALRILAGMLGVFFVAVSTTQVAWLTNSDILLHRFQDWQAAAAPGARWFLETVCIPGTPIFARLIPAGELSAGLAFIVGFWTRMSAIAAFVVVLSIHFAASAFWSVEFLRQAAGLPLLGGLLAVAIGGSRLPFSVSR